MPVPIGKNGIMVSMVVVDSERVWVVGVDDANGNFVESEAGGKFVAFQLRVTASTKQVRLE